MRKLAIILLPISIIICLTSIVIYHYMSTPVFHNPSVQDLDIDVNQKAFIEEETPFELSVDEELEQKIYTIALFGTDERKNERSRTDTIILVRYNNETKEVNMISVPRDSLVKIPGKGKDKINAAYAYGGPKLAIQTLEQLFQIKIDNYARVNFYSFLDIVNELGGVKVNVKKDIRWYDPDFKKNVYIQAGEQILTGHTLLTYVRFRKDADGDYGRMERQREVILSIVKDVLKPSNVWKFPELLNILSKNVESDLDWKTMLRLAYQIKDFDNLHIHAETLKTNSAKINGIWFEIIDEKELERIKNSLRGLEKYDDFSDKAAGM